MSFTNTKAKTQLHPVALLQLPTSCLTGLPVELLETINHTYYLHILATDPEKVLPPGKSLLSALSNPPDENKEAQETALRQKVEEMVHKAFWEEAEKTLSSSDPTAQAQRLTLLYNDLHTALSPLLPRTHPILVTLATPHDSNTASTAVLHAPSVLRGVLNALKQRCAPVRDAEADAIFARLDKDYLNKEQGGDPDVVAKEVIQATRDILRLTEEMRGDLSAFVFGGFLSESEIHTALRAEAKIRERALVEEMWGGRDRVKEEWKKWVDQFQGDKEKELSARDKWAKRLMQALSLNEPVSCPLPTKPGSAELNLGSPSTANTLPPPLLLATPALLYVQNYFQALVITSALRALVPNAGGAFVERVWSLVKGEVDEDGEGDLEAGLKRVTISEEDKEPPLKLINLADEVVQAKKAEIGDAFTSEEEQKLRATVDRTLRATDPVYVLLQSRLLAAIEERVLANVVDPKSANSSVVASSRASFSEYAGHPHTGVGHRPGPGVLPSVLKTGRSESMHSVLTPLEETPGVFFFGEKPLVIKGFDELVSEVGEVVERLGGIVGWVGWVWGDDLNTTE